MQTLTHSFRPDEQPAWNRRGMTPLAWITQRYSGPGRHEGVDYGLALETPLRAAGFGEVLDVVRGWGGGWGNHAVVGYAGTGLAIRTAHMSRVDVAIGDEVVAGQQLGTSGNTGSSTGPHLHEEVRRGFIRGDGSVMGGIVRGVPLDPLTVLVGTPPAGPQPADVDETPAVPQEDDMAPFPFKLPNDDRLRFIADDATRTVVDIEDGTHLAVLIKTGVIRRHPLGGDQVYASITDPAEVEFIRQRYRIGRG